MPRLKLITLDAEDMERVKGDHIKVIMMLRTYADLQTGECWPSQRTLAGRCDMSLGKLQRQLAQMAALEYFHVFDRGRGRSKGYRLAERFRVRFARRTKVDSLMQQDDSLGESKRGSKKDSPLNVENLESPSPAAARGTDISIRDGDPPGRRAPLEARQVAESQRQQPAKQHSLPARRAEPKSPALAAQIKDQQLQRLTRFCNARLTTAWAQWCIRGLSGNDPDQHHTVAWWRDRIDWLMSTDGWDDMLEWKRKSHIKNPPRSWSRAKIAAWREELKREQAKALTRGVIAPPPPPPFTGPMPASYYSSRDTAA